MSKGYAVAGRSADQRDVAQPVLDRHGQQFLPVRQPVDQEQRDMIDLIAQMAAFPLRPRRQPAHRLPRRGGMKFSMSSKQSEVMWKAEAGKPTTLKLSS